MPTEHHDLNCLKPCCAAKRQLRREREMLAAMNFHQRKAWRITHRRPTPRTDG